MNIPLIVALILVSMMGADPRPAERALGPWLALALTALLCVVAPLAGLLFHGLLTHSVRADGSRRFRALFQYRKLRQWLAALSLGVFFVQLSMVGYPNALYVALGDHRPIVLFKLLCLLPYLVSTVLLYIPQFLTEKELGIGRPRSLYAYCSFYFRTTVLLFLVPWCILGAAYDLMDGPLIPEFLHEDGSRDYTTLALGSALIIAVFTIAPLFLKVIWVTRPMPDGPLRRRLEEFAGRVGFTYRNILVWDTQGTGLVNAAVAGLFGFCRYVFITDTLLERMSEDEVVAVFGHEVGHARLSHMPFFLTFLVAFSMFLLALSGPVASALFACGLPGTMIHVLIPVIMIGGYWGLLFGFISRRFERQADLYGAGWTSVEAFTSALEKLAELNGVPRQMPSWRHFSIARRVDFLDKTREDPAAVRRLEANLRFALGTFLVIASASVAAAVIQNFTNLLG